MQGKDFHRHLTAMLLLVALFLTISFPAFSEEVQSSINTKKLESVRLLKEKITAADGITEDNTSENSEFSILRLFQGLGVCLAVFLAGVHIYKKYVVKGDIKNLKSLRLIERLPINGKSQLCIVEFNNKKILLGVGPDKISFFHENDILNSFGEFSDIAGFKETKELCEVKVN